jgi:dihydrodipicolinate synthase/N-acetylneuraminate lyase
MTTKKRYPVCILATACIPWDHQFRFAEDIFRRQVRTLLQGLTRHVYIFGTAGEGYAVNERQFDEICRVFREETRQPGVTAMVGVISLSLPTTIERIGRARDMGFRHFQISLPNWGALTEGEMFQFFQEVCGRFPDCGFLHYNLMRAKRLVTPDEYAILAARHPNLVATKNSTADMDRILGLVKKTPQLTHFLNETGYAYGSQLGAVGLLISVAAASFAAGKRYFAAGQKRRFAELLARQEELAALSHAMIALGISEAHIDGAYDKLLYKLHDPAFPLRMLPPYHGIRDATFRKVAAMIRKHHPRWIETKT